MLAVSLGAGKLGKFLIVVHGLVNGRLHKAFSNFLK